MMSNAVAKSPVSGKRVGLFVTCPVDLFRPTVAEAVVDVLEYLGCDVDVPAQSCCGQVGYNNGDVAETKKLALQTASAFAVFDYVVVPSGSCGGMIKHHYLDLFDQDSDAYKKVQIFSEKVFEFTTFLHDVVGSEHLPEQVDLSNLVVTYHDSCAGLREMKIKAQPRALLKKMANLDVTEMPDTNVCCGFGGTFCVKYSDISNKMVSDKIRNAQSVSPDVLTGGDVSCLLNIAGAIQRQAKPGEKTIQVRHVAELLANKLKVPAIGEAEAQGKVES